MAVNFIEKKKKEKYLIAITLLMFVAAGIIFWFGYFKDSTIIQPLVYEPTLYPENSIIIDFTIFENPFLKELQSFPPIPLYEGEIGKTNPFK